MEHNMKKFSAVIALCGVLAVPAFAASESVDAAVKTFKSVGDDADKLKIYCEMSKIMSMDEDVEDEAKAEELDKKMQDYMEQLGPDFEAAFEAGAELDPETADGKAYDGALDELDTKCAK